MGEAVVAERSEEATALVAEVAQLPAPDVLQAIKSLWPQLQHERWRMAFLLARVAREELWREAGYSSLRAWERAELAYERNLAAKYRRAGSWLMDADPVDAQRLIEAVPPVTAAEARLPELYGVDPAETLRLAESGRTKAELVQAARVRLPGQHYDAEAVVTLRLQARAVDAEKVTAAFNYLAFLGDERNPVGWQLFERFLLAVDFDEWWKLQQLDEDVAKRFPLAAILRGEVKCLDCGCRAVSQLEWHHVIPRSHQGHEGPCVCLCRDCHRKVTENVDGTWRANLRRWLRRADQQQLRDAFGVWAEAQGIDMLLGDPVARIP